MTSSFDLDIHMCAASRGLPMIALFLVPQETKKIVSMYTYSMWDLLILAY